MCFVPLGATAVSRRLGEGSSNGKLCRRISVPQLINALAQGTLDALAHTHQKWRAIAPSSWLSGGARHANTGPLYGPVADFEAVSECTFPDDVCHRPILLSLQPQGCMTEAGGQFRSSPAHRSPQKVHHLPSRYRRHTATRVSAGFEDFLGAD